MGKWTYQLDLDHIKSQVGRDAGRMVTKVVDDLDKSLTLLGNGAISITDDAKKDIENFPRIIVGMVHSPRSRGTLRLHETTRTSR